MSERSESFLQQTPDPMRQLCERYVKLVLSVGQHDPDYVDAYYGDPAWRPSGRPLPLARLLDEARGLLEQLKDRAPGHDRDSLSTLRHAFLEKQLMAIETRVRMLAGERLPFDEESRRLYDVVAPRHTEDDFAPIVAAIDERLRGAGSLAERYQRFRESFMVPADRVAAVFDAALRECRRSSREHLALPDGETFRVELVSGQPWSAYNWYQGHLTSLIQVNTDLPLAIDRALDLATHEGYPGHHVYNVLLETHLVQQRGWLEFSVYPLFSPQSVIAEGTANLGIEIAWPHDERLQFERDVLYPLAGLDPTRAAEFADVQRLVDQLREAGNEAARRYLDGGSRREDAARWLTRRTLMPPDRAEQRVRFFDRYRSYVITYTVGLTIARDWLTRRGATSDRPDAQWREFAHLLQSPQTPSSLVQPDDDGQHIGAVGGDDRPAV
jgi:hypothetical protein